MYRYLVINYDAHVIVALIRQLKFPKVVPARIMFLFAHNNKNVENTMQQKLEIKIEYKHNDDMMK